MARVRAARYYPYTDDMDGAWGTDVRRLWDEVAPSVGGTVANAGTSTTANRVITFDPYSTNTVVSDNGINLGWAINSLLASPMTMGSLLNARRYVPAGTWNVSAEIAVPAGGTVTGSVTGRVVFNFYRVSANGATRTLLFQVSTDTIASSGLGGASGVVVGSTTAPELIFEPGETLHCAILSSTTQVAGLLGATVTATNTLTTGSTTWFEVPQPGIRTIYTQEPYLALARVVGQLKVYVRKTVARTARVVGSLNRKWDAFRKYESTSSALAILRSRNILKAIEVSSIGTARDGLTTITKKALLVSAIGSAEKDKIVIKKTLKAVAAVRGVFERQVTFLRNFEGVGVGKPADLRRVVIFVRRFLMIGVPRIRPRIALDWDDLPEAGGPADFPGTNYTKSIAGVVRDSVGVPVGGAVVKLFRQSDDYHVADMLTPSSGEYVFPRDQSDPNVYYTLAYLPGSAPQTHGVSDRDLIPA